MISKLISIALLFATPLSAESVIATKTIKANSIIRRSDITSSEIDVRGSYREVSEVVGLQARKILYKGKPIYKGQVSKVSLIERNQIISIIYHSNHMRLETKGRALGEGSLGEKIKVMNLISRRIVSAEILRAGVAQVDVEQ